MSKGFFKGLKEGDVGLTADPNYLYNELVRLSDHTDTHVARICGQALEQLRNLSSENKRLFDLSLGLREAASVGLRYVKAQIHFVLQGDAGEIPDSLTRDNNFIAGKIKE